MVNILSPNLTLVPAPPPNICEYFLSPLLPLALPPNNAYALHGQGYSVPHSPDDKSTPPSSLSTTGGYILFPAELAVALLPNSPQLKHGPIGLGLLTWPSLLAKLLLPVPNPTLRWCRSLSWPSALMFYCFFCSNLGSCYFPFFLLCSFTDFFLIITVLCQFVSLINLLLFLIALPLKFKRSGSLDFLKSVSASS